MSPYRPLAAVVLAAGEGARLRSGTPKVLHELCGRPMVLHVVDALAELRVLERVVIVVGHGAERVVETLREQLVTEVPVEFVQQPVQRGTGDAVTVALTSSAFDDLDAEDDILVLPGDHPLLRAETIAMLATEHRNQDAAATILTAHPSDPTGYGRVIRDKDEGVTMVDPSRTYIDATVALESDVRLLPGTTLEGRRTISAGAVVGPDSHLVDTLVGERAVVENTVARGAEIGDDCQVGPFAYLRPGTRLAAGAKAGTFVELKNADIGAGSKVPHPAYVGDADVAAGVNLGA